MVTGKLSALYESQVRRHPISEIVDWVVFSIETIPSTNLVSERVESLPPPTIATPPLCCGSDLLTTFVNSERTGISMATTASGIAAVRKDCTVNDTARGIVACVPSSCVLRKKNSDAAKHSTPDTLIPSVIGDGTSICPKQLHPNEPYCARLTHSARKMQKSTRPATCDADGR